MATVQEAIRRLKIESTESGVAQTTDKLRRLAQAHGDLAVGSQQSERAMQSGERRLESIQRRYDQAYRAQRDLAKIERDLATARAQGLVSQQRASELMQLAIRYHNGGAQSATAHARALQALEGQAGALAGRLGAVGSVLVNIGPWGLAAAAGIGLLVYALNQAREASNKFADEMGKLRDTAQIIDLTTRQLQALNDAGAEFALTPERIANGLQRFTAQLDEARRGQGELFATLQRIDPAMARQLATARDTAAALDLMGAAYEKADASARAALSRAAFGRGGFDVGELLRSVNARGGLSALTEEFSRSGDAIDRDVIEKVRKLKREIDDMAADARNNIASIFAPGTLELERRFTEDWLEFSRSARNFSVSGDLRYLLEQVLKIKLGGPGTLLGSLGVDFRAGYKVPQTAPATPPADSFSQRFAPATESPLRSFDPGAAARDKAALELNLYRQRIALLGEAATAAERYRLRQLEINAAVAQNAELQGAANRALSAAAEAFKVERMRETVALLGSAATVTEQYELRVADLTQRLRAAGASQEIVNRALEGLRTDETIDRMRDTISALGDAATPAQQYALRVAELQRALDQGRISQEDFNRAVMASHPAFKTAVDLAVDFGSSLTQSFRQGKSASESFGNAIDNLGTQISNMLLKQAQQQAMSGDFLGAAGSAVAAIGISLLQGDAARRKERVKEFEEAQQAWADLRQEVADFTRELRGEGRGDLGGALEEAARQAQEYADAAHKAGQGHEDLQEALDEFSRRKVRDFIATFDVMIDAFDQGLGPNSPAVAAAERVRDIGESLRGFLADTALVGGNSAAVDKARASARDYVVSLLGEERQLSRVQERLLEMRGASEQLYQVLQDLGDSADQAAQRINDGLNKELAKLRNEFVRDVEAKLNEASGKGYLNQVGALIEEVTRLFADAQALGADPTLIARYFAVQSQAIVDGAGLAGDALTDLVTQFPELAGVVRDTSRIIQSEIDDLAKTIRGFLTDLRTGADSPLSPADRLKESRVAFERDLGAAQGGDRDAIANITRSASTYIDAARSFFASSGGFQDVFNQVSAALEALPGALAEQADPVVLQLEEANATLAAMNNISGSIDQSSRQLGQQAQDIATWQGSNYFGPMNDHLAQIEANTRIKGEAATPPEDDFVWWNPFTWFRDGGVVGRYAPGGIVGRYAPGGIVGNGVWNMDSVRARFAGGGDVMLAGGEGVINAPATSAIGGASMIDFINRNRDLPAPGIASPSRSFGGGANDNSALVAELQAMRAEMAALRREQGIGLARVAETSWQGSGMVAGRIERAGDQQAREARQDRAKPAPKRAMA